MKLLNATFEIESDLAEFQLRNELEGLGAKYVKTIPNSDHVKDDSHYKELVKSKKQAEKNLYTYIDSKR
ncbi:hypothetical protein Phi19:1_gp025 [Cellulophaga phage phi19:1]|uniref:Uncharacterized protein n=1 Tax=Cellulophaga phage phi19:1 TaxID=1327970 RepID=R9ZXR0_9CAUD|nr:hypothetical protein Phi19:1_gp025 [Cellulophaga phage phi19:1]AGO47315.1 hypothetical protein Phi19:1_gp025 [Cellulophaga phage phi19:1]